jgi:hypothetical protein
MVIQIVEQGMAGVVEVISPSLEVDVVVVGSDGLL